MRSENQVDIGIEEITRICGEIYIGVIFNRSKYVRFSTSVSALFKSHIRYSSYTGADKKPQQLRLSDRYLQITMIVTYQRLSCFLMKGFPLMMIARATTQRT